VIYVSANAGPSLLAGKGCHPNYFNVAYQNDNLDEVVGKYVTDAGFKNVYLLAPNYPAGKDHLAGFKRYYKGCHRRRGLHQAGPVGLRGRDRRPARGQTRRRVSFSCPGAWASILSNNTPRPDLNQTIPVFGPAFPLTNACCRRSRMRPSG
jgi:branched-chain amino acid transport system substrate-binding protein